MKRYAKLSFSLGKKNKTSLGKPKKTSKLEEIANTETHSYM